jgi:hypothetical protein
VVGASSRFTSSSRLPLPVLATHRRRLPFAQSTHPPPHPTSAHPSTSTQPFALHAWLSSDREVHSS